MTDEINKEELAKEAEDLRLNCEHWTAQFPGKKYKTFDESYPNITKLISGTISYLEKKG